MENETRREIVVTDTISVIIKQPAKTDIATAHTELVVIGRIAKAVASIGKATGEIRGKYRTYSVKGKIDNVDEFLAGYRKLKTWDDRQKYADKYGMTRAQMTRKFWYLDYKQKSGKPVGKKLVTRMRADRFPEEDTKALVKLVKSGKVLDYTALAKKYNRTRAQMVTKIGNVKSRGY